MYWLVDHEDLERVEEEREPVDPAEPDWDRVVRDEEACEHGQGRDEQGRYSGDGLRGGEEQARAEAIKKGVPEDKLDEESKKMAIEKKKKEKISDEIGDLAKLAQNAAAYEYFKALGKRIPPTIEEAVADYDEKLKELLPKMAH